MKCWLWEAPLSTFDPAVLCWVSAVGLEIGLVFVSEIMLASSNLKSYSHIFSMPILSVEKWIAAN